MTEKDNLPWYKQFWPWFLISIPLASIIGGISMIIISIDGADTLVDDNYYKEGLAINKQINKTNQAKKLGLVASLSITDEKLSMNLSNHEKVNDNLTLFFRHSTIDSRDFILKLQQTSEGNYFALLNEKQMKNLEGKWYITLEPFSKDWLLNGDWRLPSSQAFILGK